MTTGGVTTAEVDDEMIAVEEITGVAEVVGTTTADVVGTTTADVELVVGTGAAAEVEDEETTGPEFEIPN